METLPSVIEGAMPQANDYAPARTQPFNARNCCFMTEPSKSLGRRDGEDFVAPGSEPTRIVSNPMCFDKAAGIVVHWLD